MATQCIESYQATAEMGVDLEYVTHTDRDIPVGI